MYLYVVLHTRVPNEDISLYKVQRATVKGHTRLLYRNLLFPFMVISETEELNEKPSLIPKRNI